MDAPAETPRAEPARQVSRFMQESMSPSEVVAKTQSRHPGGRQNFRVVEPTLRVFPVLERF